VLYVDPSGHLRYELVKALTAAKEWVIENGVIILDGTQVVLDFAGLIPVYGELADGTNAVIYYIRGDKANAALAAGAMIPLVGSASTAGKYVVKYGDEVLAAVKGAEKNIDPNKL
jgi:hypothetical protein